MARVGVTGYYLRGSSLHKGTNSQPRAPGLNFPQRLMRKGRRHAFHRIARAHVTADANDGHHADTRLPLTRGCTHIGAAEQTGSEALQLHTGRSEAGEFHDRGAAEAQLRPERKRVEVKSGGGDVFTKFAWSKNPVNARERRQSFERKKVNLHAICGGSVSTLQIQMLHGDAAMRVALHALAGEEVNAALRMFAEAVPGTAADGVYDGRGMCVGHECAISSVARKGLRMLDAMIALLLSASVAAVSGGHFELPCMYDSRRQSMTAMDHCARREANRLRLRPDVLRRARFDRYGLTEFSCDGSWWYARRNGRTQRMDTMDNGPDYFRAGLARAIRDGKTGYVNRQLRFVIAPRYDGAMPFHLGRAEVCNGCVEKPEGEHSVLAGGSWSVVDRHGREVKDLPRVGEPH